MQAGLFRLAHFAAFELAILGWISFLSGISFWKRDGGLSVSLELALAPAPANLNCRRRLPLSTYRQFAFSKLPETFRDL
jgi:hypothetical protein